MGGRVPRAIPKDHRKSRLRDAASYIGAVWHSGFMSHISCPRSARFSCLPTMSNAIEDVFDIGREIDTWETIDELREKAQWWLAYDDERAAAGRRARRRIFDDYGNMAYARKLIEFVGA